MALHTFPMRRNRQPVAIGPIVAVIGLLLGSIFVGLMTAFLPPGFLVRALVFPFGLGFLALSWALRRNGAGMPGKLVLLLLLGTICLSVLWPRYIFFSLGGPHVNPQTLSVFASLAVIMFWLTYSPEMSKKFYETLFSSGKVGVLALIWFAWRFFAAAVGEVPLLSVFENVRDMVYLSSFLMIGCAVASYENGPKWMLRVIVFSGLMVAAAGLVEAFLQKNHFVQFAAGRDSAAVADALKTIMLDKIRGGSYRAQAIFDHPIVFAQFIAAMVPLAVYFIFYERGVFWRTVGLLLIPIGVLAIVKSGSRAGLVSLAVALAFVAVVIWLRSMTSKGFGKAVAIAALPAFVLGIGVAYVVVQELVLGRSQVEASSTSVRLKMMTDGINALVESPIWGFGHGMALYKAGVMSTTGTATIDSFLLTIALDSGYVGLLLFIAIIAVFSIKGAIAAVRLPGEEGGRVGLIVASVLALVATFAGLSIANNLTLLWLLVAIALPSINKASKLPKSTR